MYIPYARKSQRESKLVQAEERARLRRVYSRNLILIILSLGLAIAIFIFTRFFASEPMHPQAVKLQGFLHEAIPQVSFSVSIEEAGGVPDIEITAVFDKAPADLKALIARVEKVIYHNAGFDRAIVIIRLMERLQSGDDTELASLAVKRTSLSEMQRDAER
ncbi:MAG TPA: hypothetical protein VMX35_02270 [Acidobacteriota bacterium]|nr:hypothetical protein [Acidobacteriota bacterium]